MVDLFNAEPGAVKHLTGTMRNFRTVELFNYTSGSVLGVLQSHAKMLGDEWLGPLATHGGRYILLVVDIAIFNRLMHLIHTDTRWEEDEELLQLLRQTDTRDKLAARVERLQSDLDVLKTRLGQEAGEAGTNKRMVQAINDALAADAEVGEKVARVTEATISRLLNDKYTWDGPVLQVLERALLLLGGAEFAGDEEDYEPDAAAGAKEAARGATRPAGSPVEGLEYLRKLRFTITKYLRVFPDTFHVAATYAKVVYAQYRGFFFAMLYPRLFPRGKALPKRKLVQLRFIYLVLRLATTEDVVDALMSWYNDALVESGKSDPRAEALFTLLLFHLPLVAQWERALLHGPVEVLQELLPLFCLVRCSVARPALATLTRTPLRLFPRTCRRSTSSTPRRTPRTRWRWRAPGSASSS